MQEIRSLSTFVVTLVAESVRSAAEHAAASKKAKMQKALIRRLMVVQIEKISLV